MPSILFVCTANCYRSPLAAAFFRKILLEKADRDWIVDSAGIKKHRSKQLDEELLDRFDLILGMEMGHKEALQVEFPGLRGRIYSFSEAVENRRYDIPDPFDDQRHIDNSVGVDIYKLVTMKYKNIVRLTKRVAGKVTNR